jgi:hypothetical protein
MLTSPFESCIVREKVFLCCHDRNPVPAAREEREGNRAAGILGDRLPVMLIVSFC